MWFVSPSLGSTFVEDVACGGGYDLLPHSPRFAAVCPRGCDDIVERGPTWDRAVPPTFPKTHENAQ